MKTILEKTIKSLSKKETINYKMYANRQNKTENRKDIALFDAIKNSKKEDIPTLKKHTLSASGLRESQPPKSLQIKANTIRKLKVRLLDEVGNSLVQFYFHENDYSYLYNELNLFDIFYQKSEWEVAHFHLQRAEKMATKTQNFKLLAVIYDEFIKLSVYYGNVLPQEYVNKRKQNENNIKDIQLFNDAVNSVKYELQRNFALIKTSKKLTDTLHQIIESLGQKKEFKNNLVFKHKLIDAISRLLIAKREFKTLEVYCIKSYNEFDKKKFFTKETHETKLQLLCYICNSLHENKKNEQALVYLTTLNDALSEHSGILRDKYLFFYYNSMANNYTVLNPQKAIHVLLEAKKAPVIMNNSTHAFYIYWNLAGAYFDEKQYKNALKNSLMLKELDSFAQLSESLQLHILIFEIVLRIDLKEVEFVRKQLRDVIKKYSETLNKEEHRSDYDFLLLVKKVYVGNTLRFTITTKNIFKAFIEKEYMNQNNNVVDYQKWLQTKYMKD